MVLFYQFLLTCNFNYFTTHLHLAKIKKNYLVWEKMYFKFILHVFGYLKL